MSEADPKSTKYLILHHLYKASQELERSADTVIKNEDSTIGSKIEFFRYDYSTQITTCYFNQLSDLLSSAQHLLQDKKTSANLKEQYCLFYTLNVFKAAVQSMNVLDISLANILTDRADFDRFMKAFDATVQRIVN